MARYRIVFDAAGAPDAYVLDAAIFEWGELTYRFIDAEGHLLLLVPTPRVIAVMRLDDEAPLEPEADPEPAFLGSPAEEAQ